MNFARLNHILIPTTKKERDRFRRSSSGRLAMRLFSWLLYYSDEGRWALLLWLVSGAVSLNVGTTQFFYLFSGLTALMMSVLVLVRRFRLSAVALWIDTPRRIAVGEPLTLGVNLENLSDARYFAIRIHTPFLPWDGKWILRPEGVKTLSPKETARRNAVAVFTQRGAHHLDMFHASMLLPLGLSNGPAVSSKGVRFLVVPHIAKIERLSLPLKSRYQPGGVALASASGESRELVGIRPYRPGDPIRDLHAASWARLGEPLVREFRQEYFTRIGIVVDTDETAVTEQQFEASLSLAAGLVSHLSRGEALIDLVVFGDTVHTLMVGRHLGFLDQALDLLACVETAPPWSLTRLKRNTADHLGKLSAMLFVTAAWDEKRHHFGEWVAAAGVGFRAFQVMDKGGQKGDPSLTQVPIPEIMNGRVVL